MKIKKLLCAILCICLILPAFFMVGCKDEEPTNSRMTVDLNPSVEFMLDKDNKVVSVTALNDDGSVIIYGETFVGLTAEAAAEKFAEIAKQTGYLVEEQLAAIDNKIKVSINGNQELLNNVKNKMSTWLQNNNITADVESVASLTKDQLATLVSKTGTTETLTELKNKTEEQLLKILEEERKNAKTILSPAIQEAYYNAKNYKITLTENEFVKNALADIDLAASLTFNAIYSTIGTAQSALNTARESLTDENGTYQQAVKALLSKRQELLEQKIAIENETDSTLKQQKINALAGLITAVEGLETALNTTYTTTTSSIDMAQQTLDSIIAQLDTVRENFSSNVKTELNKKAGELETALNNAKDGFFAEFEAEYSEQITAYNNYIANMKAELKAQTTPAA